jgi:peptidoglycan hydrolase-like protein with peptidoglycan-binding domain
MPNPGQPTIREGARGEPVRRAQRALHRTGGFGDVLVDGVFGPDTRRKVEAFQHSSRLVADGVVGPRTWAALPDGAPMPELREGAHGPVVQSLQRVLANGASQWHGPPLGAADGDFGPKTKAAVEAFQANFARLPPDGVVGDRTWATSLHAAGATLESAVGLQYVVH